jgi:hypothetical protein
MKITRDVPGSRLTLEGDAPRIPPGAPTAVLFVVTLPFFAYTLWMLPGPSRRGRRAAGSRSPGSRAIRRVAPSPSGIRPRIRV